MSTPQPTLQQLYRSIKVLPLALMVGLVLMTSVILYLNQDAIPNESIEEFFVIGIALLAAISAVLGSYLFRKKINETVGKPIVDKVVLYRQATILRFALLEGPALIALVLFHISGNYLFMVITGAMFLFMLLNRPTDDMIAQHLNLTESDKQFLNKVM